MPLAELLAAFAAAARQLGVRWYLFGAQAALLFGAARLTADVDVTVDLGERPTQLLVDALAGHGFSLRIANVDEFVARTRVLPLVHDASGIPVDVVLAGPGPEELFLQRARDIDIAGTRIPVAAPEDLVVMKVLAGRPKDLDDALAILAAQADAIDLGAIRATLHLLEQALDQRDLLPALEALAARARR